MKLQVVEILSSLRIRAEFSDDDPWNEYFKRRVELLEIDWMFLDMFVGSVEIQSKKSYRWRQFLSSVTPKLSSSASCIRRGLQLVQDEADLSGSKPTLVELIDDSQRETDILKSLLRKALDKVCKVDYFAASFASSDQWKFFFHDEWELIPVRCKDLILKLQGIRRDYSSSDDINIEQVKLLINSLQEVILYAQFIADVKWYLSLGNYRLPRFTGAIAIFIDHVRSVAVRIEIHSCNCWFSMSRNCNTRPPTSYNCWFNCNVEPTDLAVSKKFSRLVDLHHQIDPINPVFLELNLNFREAIRESRDSFTDSDFSWRRTHHFISFNDDDFLRSIIGWKGDYEFKGQMMYLLAIVITNKLDCSREDVKTFFAEIRAVIEKATSLSWPSLGQGNEGDPPPPSLSELDRNICLLKAEYFLKYHLKRSYFHVEGFKFNISSGYLLKPHATTDCWKHSLALIKDVEDKVASLRQSYSANQCSISMLKISLRQSLLEIVISKAEFFLFEFLKSNATAMSHEKAQVESLLEHLKVFHIILTNMLIKEELEEVEIIFTHTEVFARRITLFSNSFFPNTITEETLAISFSKLLDKAQHIKAKLKEISPMFPVSNFPTTYKVGFIDFLLRNLGELLKYSPKSIAPMKKHIEEIQVHLKSFLVKVSDSDMENPGLKDLIDHMTGVVYKLDYVTESIEVDAHWQHFLWFYDLLEELRLVDKQASSVYATISDATVQNFNCVTISDAIVQNVNSVTISDATVQTVKIVTISDATIQSANNVTQDSHNEVVLELKDEEEFIIDRLTRGSSQRDVVSIVGMPGIGKTTLATKVFNNKQIKYHFHRLAWCNVSQVYEKRKLLLEIINGIQGLTSATHQMSTEDLELKLRRCLLKNKYLIVMDDVWSVGAWNDLKNLFPNDSNGSRILLTSRQRNVALEIKSDSDPYSLRPFSVEESWKLLEKKVFKGEGCPEQLLMVGKEIAQRCQGLPLAVVAIAGLLERTEKSLYRWRRVAESLSSQIINDPETRCMEILELSYKYLPEHLKACFIYLAVFLEDNHIPVTKVMRFWLAEGFIKTDSKSLEDVAEEYMMDLINRSLVIISKRRTDGKVKECRLHDLLRDFCTSKAKEEKFFQLITRSDEPYASFPGSDYGIEFYFDQHLDPVAFESYRLSINLKRKHFIDSRPSGPGTRSLIFFASNDSEPRCPYDISFICDNFKYLRVLDLECINMGNSFPTEIELLVQLRYLAVSGYLQSIPQSIGNLWKLETLVVLGLRGKVILPHTIWHMTRLRHLHVNKYVAFCFQHEKVGCSFQLDNLVSLSFPALSYGEDTEKILSRFPNLRKMKCIFLESWDSSKNCNQFPALNLLTHLVSLKIIYYGRARNPGEFILPWSLKQLTLSNFCLPWDHIAAIGKLPNLEVLKLVSGAFEGQIWDMREEEFQELKFLKLDTLDIAQWNATSNHLPKLQRLVLRNCESLHKVPYDFADITSLETIEVHWCGQSAEESSREIGEATGEIKVLISHS